MGDNNHGCGEYRPRPSKDNPEWYTPPEIITFARAVLGGIDLDPASCQAANEQVGATVFYDRQSDGLSQQWHGKVWLNPPYGRRNSTGVWWQKLVEEYDAGRVSEALFLANATTETAWFQHALTRFPILLLRGRLKFWRVGGGSRNGFFGSCIVYLPPQASSPIRPQDRPLDPIRPLSVSVRCFVGLGVGLGLTIVNMNDR